MHTIAQPAIADNPAVLPLPPLVEALTLAGYTLGAPAHVRAETLAIDEQVIRRSRCSACHRRGQQCRFFHRGRSFRAVSICGHCQHAEER